MMKMSKASSSKVRVSCLLNGLFAYFLGSVLYMIPAFIVSMKMGFSLGSQGLDPAVISAEIHQKIFILYQENLLLILLMIFSTSFFIFWRSRVVGKKHGDFGIGQGLLVSAIPVVLTIIFIFTGSFHWTSLIEILFYTAAGYLSAVFFKRAEFKNSIPN